MAADVCIAAAQFLESKTSVNLNFASRAIDFVSPVGISRTVPDALSCFNDRSERTNLFFALIFIFAFQVRIDIHFDISFLFVDRVVFRF